MTDNQEYNPLIKARVYKLFERMSGESVAEWRLRQVGVSQVLNEVRPAVMGCLMDLEDAFEVIPVELDIFRTWFPVFFDEEELL